MAYDKCLGDLPDDIIFHVLSWLPANDLVLLRTVCKLWFSTISSPEFIQHHRSQHLGRSTMEVIPKEGVVAGDLLSLSTLDLSAYMECVEHLHFSIKKWEASGSCNGLVCYTHCDLVLVCNPSIGRTLSLPRPPFVHSLDMEVRDFSGVGFDLVSNDYKVVRMNWVDDVSGIGAGFTEFAVFSLSLRLWKILEPCPSFPRLGVLALPMGPSSYFNGFIHWLSYDDRVQGIYIITFDTSNEVFGEIRLSEAAQERRSSRHSLAVVNGRVCILISKFNGECEVWSMEEYGVVESWTRVLDVVLVNCCDIRLTSSGKIFLSCCGWTARDGKMVYRPWECKYGLVSYDPATGKYSNVCQTLQCINTISVEATLELLLNN